MKKLALIAAVGVAFFGSAQATEFITNGTFSDPHSSIQSGWVVTGGNNVGFFDNSFYNGSFGTTGTLSQNIMGAVGALYLSFDYYSTGKQYYPGMGSNNHYQYTYFNGALISEINLTTTNQRYTFTVTGTGNDTLAFTGANWEGSNVLSNVSLTSAVPEPESYALLLAGLGLIGAVSRRKQKK
jgi:hypothetical protein